jgi:hypothetical protein
MKSLFVGVGGTGTETVLLLQLLLLLLTLEMPVYTPPFPYSSHFHHIPFIIHMTKSSTAVTVTVLCVVFSSASVA